MGTKKFGRPKAFDPETALDAAMRLFWRKGYEGASLADLTDAMGIGRPSLYAEFGCKEGLFRRALDHYAAGAELPEASSAREAFEIFLRATAAGGAHPEHPGCLLVTGGLTCGDEAVGARDALAAMRNGLVETWRARFAAAQALGELSPDADPAALAAFTMAVANGMAVLAVGGASAETLRGVAEAAIRAWPD